MKQTLSAALLSLSLGLSTTAAAGTRSVQVEITNLTNGTYFTPLLVAAHPADVHLFQVGTAASESVRAMAEGGSIDGLIDEVEAAGGSYADNPANGLLAPGAMATATLDVDRRDRHLSIAAMLLPTNDGFVGLDAMRLPRHPGVYTLYLNGYDAGTEANDELITGGGDPGAPGIPADPGDNGGTEGTGVADADHNGLVHIHRGVVGDLDSTGGPSDLDAGIHRWLNPVAKVVVTVGRSHRR